jgi:hypothetical protein
LTWEQVAQYAHTPDYQEGEENEWELLHSIKEVEYALQVCQKEPWDDHKRALY